MPSCRKVHTVGTAGPSTRTKVLGRDDSILFFMLNTRPFDFSAASWEHARNGPSNGPPCLEGVIPTDFVKVRFRYWRCHLDRGLQPERRDVLSRVYRDTRLPCLPLSSRPRASARVEGPAFDLSS